MSSGIIVIEDERSKSNGMIDDYVFKSEGATIYHLSRWRNIIKNNFGHRTYCICSMNDQGKPRGILPLVHMKSILFGNMLVSLPYFNYGGVSADNSVIERSLIDEAVRIAKSIGARHIELRQEKRFENGFGIKTSKVSMRLALSGSTEDLWKSFPSKLRSQISKPMKEGMSSRIGKSEEIDCFYEVFATNMRDLGTPVYPKKFFRNILESFPDNSWINTIYTGRQPVASGFLIGFKERMEIPWASSLRKYNRQSPNMLLYWNCLKFSCEQGYHVFDFGRSTPGEGTYRFKEQWGAKPAQLYWNYWMADGEKVPEINPKNRKYHFAIRCWKHLPVGLTKQIGPWIIKNIP